MPTANKPSASKDVGSGTGEVEEVKDEVYVVLFSIVAGLSKEKLNWLFVSVPSPEIADPPKETLFELRYEPPNSNGFTSVAEDQEIEKRVVVSVLSLNKTEPGETVLPT